MLHTHIRSIFYVGLEHPVCVRSFCAYRVGGSYVKTDRNIWRDFSLLDVVVVINPAVITILNYTDQEHSVYVVTPTDQTYPPSTRLIFVVRRTPSAGHNDLL